LDWGIPKIRVPSTPPTVGPLFQEHPSDRGIPKRRALGFTASGPLSWEWLNSPTNKIVWDAKKGWDVIEEQCMVK